MYGILIGVGVLCFGFAYWYVSRHAATVSGPSSEAPKSVQTMYNSVYSSGQSTNLTPLHSPKDERKHSQSGTLTH